MAKAQASLEFMLLFAATLGVVALLAAALLAERGRLEAGKDGIESINKAEAAARAVEAMLNSGVEMAFGFTDEGVKYGVENGMLHVAYQGRVIEIGGVYSGNSTEPV